jgi:hypothetical protein
LERADREDVTARAGLPLVVETMRALGLDAVARAELPAPKRQRGFGPEEKLEVLVTLIAVGGDRVEDVQLLGEDQGLETLLGRPFPSPDALLDFLGQFHDPQCWEDRPPEKKAYVPRESDGLRALEAVNRALVARGADRSATVATIDHDGTIIASHKRDATIAYEGTAGTSRSWRCGPNSSSSWPTSSVTATSPAARIRCARSRGRSRIFRRGSSSVASAPTRRPTTRRCSSTSSPRTSRSRSAPT